MIENLKHVGNMRFLIQNINTLIQCIHDIEPNLSVAYKYEHVKPKINLFSRIQSSEFLPIDPMIIQFRMSSSETRLQFNDLKLINNCCLGAAYALQVNKKWCVDSTSSPQPGQKGLSVKL